MKDRIFIIAAVAAIAAACAQIIDLGPEATLEEQAGTGGFSTRCGIPAGATERCNTCWETNCCAEGLVCAQDPRCVEATEAYNDCLFEIQCVMQVNLDYEDAPGFAEFAECSFGCGTVCLPEGDCMLLAQCCQQIAVQMIRDACRTAIYEEDQQRCREALDTVFRQECPQ